MHKKVLCKLENKIIILDLAELKSGRILNNWIVKVLTLLQEIKQEMESKSGPKICKYNPF